MQHVGSQVAVICDTFGNYASFSDLDLGDPRKADRWRLTPESKASHMLHRIVQEKGELALCDCSGSGEPPLQLAEILTQQAAGEASDQRISKPISWASRAQNFIGVGLGPTFNIATKCCDPTCILIARPSDELCCARSDLHDA